MRLDREHACDDLVIATGWKPSEYAANLVEIASSLRARSVMRVNSTYTAAIQAFFEAQKGSKHSPDR